MIVCNTDHIEAIEDEDGNINHRDTIQDVPVADNRLILKLKSGDEKIIALTSRKPRKKDLKRTKTSWPAAAVEVITISPFHLTALQKEGFPTYNQDLIKKARFESLVNLIRINFKISTLAAVDTLTVGMLQFTLLHEVRGFPLAKSSYGAMLQDQSWQAASSFNILLQVGGQMM